MAYDFRNPYAAFPPAPRFDPSTLPPRRPTDYFQPVRAASQLANPYPPIQPRQVPPVPPPGWMSPMYAYRQNPFMPTYRTAPVEAIDAYNAGRRAAMREGLGGTEAPAPAPAPAALRPMPFAPATGLPPAPSGTIIPPGYEPAVLDRSFSGQVELPRIVPDYLDPGRPMPPVPGVPPPAPAPAPVENPVQRRQELAADLAEAQKSVDMTRPTARGNWSVSWEDTERHRQELQQAEQAVLAAQERLQDLAGRSGPEGGPDAGMLDLLDKRDYYARMEQQARQDYESAVHNNHGSPFGRGMDDPQARLAQSVQRWRDLRNQADARLGAAQQAPPPTRPTDFFSPQSPVPPPEAVFTPRPADDGPADIGATAREFGVEPALLQTALAELRNQGMILSSPRRVRSVAYALALKQREGHVGPAAVQALFPFYPEDYLEGLERSARSPLDVASTLAGSQDTLSAGLLSLGRGVPAA